MKLYKQAPYETDYVLLMSEDHPSAWLEPIDITEEKLKQYLWDEQPFIGGPDDLVRIFMDVLSKLSGE